MTGKGTGVWSVYVRVPEKLLKYLCGVLVSRESLLELSTSSRFPGACLLPLGSEE